MSAIFSNLVNAEIGSNLNKGTDLKIWYSGIPYVKLIRVRNDHKSKDTSGRVSASNKTSGQGRRQRRKFRGRSALMNGADPSLLSGLRRPANRAWTPTARRAPYPANVLARSSNSPIPMTRVYSSGSMAGGQ